VEAGLLEASDEEQLAYAVSQQRALVTHNVKDFPGEHARWIETGRKHWGIIILVGHSAVGVWLRRMESLLNLFSAEELQNQLLFLGAEYNILVTDLFHTRRAARTFRTLLPDTAIYVNAAPDPRYHAGRWWQNEEGLVAVVNEVIKLAFYWAKYGITPVG
jgi:hypothetical protein